MSDDTGFKYPFEELVRDRYKLTGEQWDVFCAHSLSFARAIMFCSVTAQDYSEEQLRTFLTLTLRRTETEISYDLVQAGCEMQKALSAATAFMNGMTAMQSVAMLEKELQEGKPPASHRKNWQGKPYGK